MVIKFKIDWTVFLYHDNRMIGFGRAISDGAYQAGIYDVAVEPEFQNKGIGNMIIENILEKIPDCNVILYASPGKEDFYFKNSFRRTKTGMALFTKLKKYRRKDLLSSVADRSTVVYTLRIVR